MNPKNQLNNKPILQNLQHIDVYIDKIAQYQELGYNYIIDYIECLDSSVEAKIVFKDFWNKKISFEYMNHLTFVKNP